MRTHFRSLARLVCAGLLAGSGLVSAVAAAGTPLDINSASANELSTQLHGIGSARAEAIIEDREANGPFHSVDDLMRVSGIGPVTVEDNRDRMAADAPSEE